MSSFPICSINFGSRDRELYPRRTCPLEDEAPPFDTVYRYCLHVESRAPTINLNEVRRTTHLTWESCCSPFQLSVHILPEA
jgi:hypothetical protein